MKKRTIFVIIVAAAVVAIFAYELIAGRNPAASKSFAEQSAASSSIALSVERAFGDEATWLRFDGTDIDGPVMQAGDNEYYLRRNEEGEEDVWGCYFLDYECGPGSQNYVIYPVLHHLQNNRGKSQFCHR